MTLVLEQTRALLVVEETLKEVIERLEVDELGAAVLDSEIGDGFYTNHQCPHS